MLRLRKGNSGIVTITSGMFMEYHFKSINLILKRYRYLYKGLWCFFNMQDDGIFVSKNLVIIEFLDLQYVNALSFLKELASKLTFRIMLVYVK